MPETIDSRLMDDLTSETARAVKAIFAAERILITSHINPDGDALGSVLALVHALTALGKTAVPIMHDTVPDIYKWMPGAELVRQVTDVTDSSFDLAIVCDAGMLDRVGMSVRPLVDTISPIIDIDHHVADGPFGDIRILDSSAAATAELVWDLLQALSQASSLELNRPVELIAAEGANCLMTGLITDTGSFRYPNTTPRSFQLAADLQRLGALPADISELVYENRSYESIKLLGRALGALQVSPDGRLAWTHVTAQDFLDFNATDADTESIVSHVRAVRGAQIGILFREVPGKKVRISLRARVPADVNSIANVFGGGGHRLAAGCSMDPPLAEVERLVLQEAMRQLHAL